MSEETRLKGNAQPTRGRAPSPLHAAKVEAADLAARPRLRGDPPCLASVPGFQARFLGLGSSLPAPLLLSVLAVLVLGARSLQAEDVFVTSTVDSSGTLNSCPPSCCDNLGTTTTSSAYSIATPAGLAPRKTRFGISSLATWTVTPTLACSPSIYKVHVSQGTTGSCPTDLIVRITAVSGCTLLDTNGISRTTIDTDAFARGKSLNVWTHVCDINNFSHTPTITFSWVSGGFNRWYMDEVRFQGLDCCCCGFVPAPGITGPLAAGQTNVSVTAVLAGAINVTVYANLTIPIGWTNYAPGFAGGTITVPTVALVRGDTITATQTRTNAAGEPCTSGQPASGPIVGSGGPKLILSLGCQKNTSLTGPIGAPTPNPGTDTLYWVKATGTAFGLSGSAPVGGWEVIPSQCWQTFVFNWQTDPCLAWLGNTAYTETNAFAVLESLAIGMDGNDLDSGPYVVYVDKIMNGNVVLADFECDAAGVGYPDGTANVNFANPNATAIPPPDYFLSNPLSTRISGKEAVSGTNSCRFEWQFVDNERIRWCRLLMNKAPLVYPQVDTTKPVTLSVLVLPADVDVGHKFNGTVSAITNSTPICTAGSVTMGVTVTGSGSYTYQWSNAVGQIPGATAQTYTAILPGKPPYSIIVSDGTCSVTPAPINLDASVRPVTITGMSGSILTYGGGNGCQFVLLQSADGTAPLANWTTNAIGTVLPGSFTIPTVGAGAPMYYIIRSE